MQRCAECSSLCQFGVRPLVTLEPAMPGWSSAIRNVRGFGWRFPCHCQRFQGSPAAPIAEHCLFCSAWQPASRSCNLYTVLQRILLTQLEHLKARNLPQNQECSSQTHCIELGFASLFQVPSSYQATNHKTLCTSSIHCQRRLTQTQMRREAQRSPDICSRMRCAPQDFFAHGSGHQHMTK